MDDGFEEVFSRLRRSRGRQALLYTAVRAHDSGEGGRMFVGHFAAGFGAKAAADRLR